MLLHSISACWGSRVRERGHLHFDDKIPLAKEEGEHQTSWLFVVQETSMDCQLFVHMIHYTETVQYLTRDIVAVYLLPC